MQLLFLYVTERDIDVGTPWTEPIGGSESAMCYLAIELARRGHRVLVATGTTQPRTVRGVECLHYRRLSSRDLQQPWDAVIVLNGPAEFGVMLRPTLRPDVPLVLWTQHAADQLPMHDLRDPAHRAAWDVVVCLSHFQRDQLVAEYGLDPARTTILGNGIAPVFENLFASVAELAAVKAQEPHPVLAYTSTPFRGLNLLLALYPRVWERYPAARLRIYSSMQVYGTPLAEDKYRQHYTDARLQPGIEYVGSLPQPQLAAALRTASILAYPNSFAETYCIAAAEALAAGLVVVTTDLGALPETLMGQGVLVPPLRDGSEWPVFQPRYLAALLNTLDEATRDPAAFAARQFAGVRLVNERCSYRARATEWEAAIPTWRKS